MSRLDLPPVWLLLFIALGRGLAALVPWPGTSPFMTAAGWSLVGLGLVLAASAAAGMWRARTTVIPHRQPSALVTSGVFRLSRNPIYLGDALILAGCALVFGSAAALALVPGFIALISLRFIAAEEARLAAAFGPEFRAWTLRTRRWI